MTEPTPTDPEFPKDAGMPDDAASDASSQAVISEANRLGLQWQLRAATITSFSPVLGIYDGDTVSIAMTSMVGSVRIGQRVYVIAVPPSGNFITGFTTGPYLARQTLATTQPTVIFNNIPSALRRLTVRFSSRVSGAVNLAFLGVQVNGDASTSYFWEQTQGLNTTASATPFGPLANGIVGFSTGASAGAGSFGVGVADFVNWDQAQSSRLAWVFNSGGFGTGVANFVNLSGTGLYGAATTRYTSLTFIAGSGSFISGTDFQLEGYPT